MCSNKKCMQGRQEISNPSLCHSAVEKNVPAGIMKLMPNIPRFGGAFGCAGLLLTPVIQDSENKPGMEAG